MAESICETVGEIHKSTGAVDEDKGHLIRVWVTLVITLPLCRGRLMTLVNSTKSWVSFKYERLSNLCYWCGRLNQDDKHCDLWVQSKGSLKAEHQQFGPSLRAPPYTSAGKDVIFVPGYYDQRPMKSAEMPGGKGTTLMSRKTLEIVNLRQPLQIWKPFLVGKTLMLKIFKIQMCPLTLVSREITKQNYSIMSPMLLKLPGFQV